MATKYEFHPIPELEEQISGYIELEKRLKLLEQIPGNSTARLKILAKLIKATHPNASLPPKLLQYAIGGNPRFPRCIGAMVDRLAREDKSFPADVLCKNSGKKNPNLGKAREDELLELLS